MPIHVGNPFVELQWNRLLTNARSHADLMAQGCSQPFKDIISAILARFCTLGLPSADELAVRTTQYGTLNSLLSSVCSASTMAIMHPAVQNDIIQAVSTLDTDDVFSPQLKPSDLFNRKMLASSSVSAICTADTMRQLREMQ